MKGLWILGGLVMAAALLVFALTRESSADLERLYADTVRDRPTIEAALEECGDLVRYFSEIKPTERKKGELEALRRRFEILEKEASAAREEATRPREERRKLLARINDDFFELKRDAEDLRARLREMKNYEAELRPRIAELGTLTQKLLQMQSSTSDPEFQQRAGQLIDEGRRYRLMAEESLRTLSVSIAKGRSTGIVALNELDATLKNMKALQGTDAAPGGQ